MRNYILFFFISLLILLSSCKTGSGKLNIQLNHQNWTDNNPVVTWDAYPGADNGYCILVFINDKIVHPRGNPDGRHYKWCLVVQDKVYDTKYEVFSNYISFVPIEMTCGQGIIPPSITEGEEIGIQVYVLDGSEEFDFRKQKGYVYMETLIVKRK